MFIAKKLYLCPETGTRANQSINQFLGWPK